MYDGGGVVYHKWPREIWPSENSFFPHLKVAVKGEGGVQRGGGGVAIKAEGVCRWVVQGVRTRAPFEEGVDGEGLDVPPLGLGVKGAGSKLREEPAHEGGGGGQHLCQKTLLIQASPPLPGVRGPAAAAPLHRGMRKGATGCSWSQGGP